MKKVRNRFYTECLIVMAAVYFLAGVCSLVFVILTSEVVGMKASLRYFIYGIAAAVILLFILEIFLRKKYGEIYGMFQTSAVIYGGILLAGSLLLFVVSSRLHYKGPEILIFVPAICAGMGVRILQEWQYARQYNAGRYCSPEELLQDQPEAERHIRKLLLKELKKDGNRGGEEESV